MTTCFNKYRTISFFSTITLLALLSSLLSCRDDLFYDNDYEEGFTDVQASVVLSPVTDALATRATGGAAIKNVADLCVLFFQNNRLVRSEYYPEGSLPWETVKQESPGDAVLDGEQAEAMTPRVSFRIKDVENGNYNVYAVANMGDIAAEYRTAEGTDTITPDGLKSIMLTWNSENPAANNQMFGYFSTENESQGFNAPAITIKPGRSNLHAWLKRAASKVTVAIDGSNLYDGVQVFIRSIEIKDIPSQCYLGNNHTVKEERHLIENGEHYDIDGVDDMNEMKPEGPSVSNSAPYFYPGIPGGKAVTLSEDKKEEEAAHSETQAALYFFENMQGTGQSKHQVWNQGAHFPQFPNGNDPMDAGYKDGKPLGTYIEVHGYYKGYRKYTDKDGISSEPSEGPIIYRFMLGKNTEDDYNAQRNYHYKLTLRLKGNGNDSDWHIVYDEEPKMVIPDPYYISYLYNQSMYIPIQMTGVKKLISLTGEIPEDLQDNKDAWKPRQTQGAADPSSTTPKAYYTGDVHNPGPWNGFLSLTKTAYPRYGVFPIEFGFHDPLNPDAFSEEYILNLEKGTQEQIDLAKSIRNKFASSKAETYEANEKYFHGEIGGGAHKGYRIYFSNENGVTPGVYGDDLGACTVSTNGAGEWQIKVPLFTRAAVMVSQTGYTGNNPYVSYRRMERVKFTAQVIGYDNKPHTIHCEPKDPTQADMENNTIAIYQMRRVVNPTGIWREAGNTDAFDVRIKVLTNEFGTDFEDLVSDGPWKAVIKNGDWFTLETGQEESQKNADGSISGTGDMFARPDASGKDLNTNKGRIINFKFKPKSATSQPRFGIIKVFYNNYTCIHLIFVRQGYAPVAFRDAKAKWHTFNLVKEGTETSSPVTEGSYFKRFNIGQPIHADNNNLNAISRGATYVWNDRSNEYFTLANGKSSKYGDITYDPNGKWSEFKVNGTTCRLPDAEDVQKILGNQDVVYGYGVLYCDNATSTQTKVVDAYENFGMRGVFVCDTVYGTQIFLPIGKTGFGRFKQRGLNNLYTQSDKVTGANQYANRWQPFPTGIIHDVLKNGLAYNVEFKPLFWDIYRRHGAIYWLDREDAIDINFYTLDISVAKQSDDLCLYNKNGSSAVQIRLVEGPTESPDTKVKRKVIKKKVVRKKVRRNN